MLKIGITERGDAGLDLSWRFKLSQVNGVILITKNITPGFKKTVLENKDTPMIIHCTCTGWGASIMEPCVPDYKTQIENLTDLIAKGFPAENVVFRIDPIFPTPKGLERVEKVIECIPKEISRVRISIIDEYKHVKQRYRELAVKYNNPNIKPIYGDYDIFPSEKHCKLVADTLKKYNYTFETCAEDQLKKYMPNVQATGCISKRDLELMNIEYTPMSENIQNRKGCHCLSCKTELLTNKKQCPHKCVYCYWR